MLDMNVRMRELATRRTGTPGSPSFYPLSFSSRSAAPGRSRTPCRARGRLSVKLDPAPTVLWSVMSPFMARARSLLIGSPSPTPPRRSVKGFSSCTNGSNTESARSAPEAPDAVVQPLHYCSHSPCGTIEQVSNSSAACHAALRIVSPNASVTDHRNRSVSVPSVPWHSSGFPSWLSVR
jgi:hypothetical protein